jgi:hypothetical protein
LHAGWPAPRAVDDHRRVDLARVDTRGQVDGFRRHDSQVEIRPRDLQMRRSLGEGAHYRLDLSMIN